MNIDEDKKYVCKKDMCSGCMACVDICPKNAISIKRDIYAYNAVINSNLCINCNLCHKVCQYNSSSEIIYPMKWYQGWSKNKDIREKSSSGGIASELIKTFINNGGFVVSCAFINGEFKFIATDNLELAKSFSGSKYVKSNPSESYKITNDLLNKGLKVLYIGLPCQVSSLKNFINLKNKKRISNLYTVDLICHGTPSEKVLEIFLEQYNLNLKDIDNIKFRTKNISDHENYNCLINEYFMDYYSTAFLNGICFTENCYSCKYSKKERVSDITIGDSWGSDLEESEKNKGISLILCQTTKGLDLINKADIELKFVDFDNACKSNRQLNHPFIKPKDRDKFLNAIELNKSFKIQVIKLFPKLYFKFYIKNILSFFKLYKNKLINYNIYIRK